MNIRRLAAAAGLATGAALAFAPLAAADTSSSDWFSAVDGFLSGASPAASTPINLYISFDGYTLYNGGGTALATTGTGQYGLAIAYGDHADASAYGGSGDYALASGTNAGAFAAGGNGDSATAIGTNANAEAGSLADGATGNNYDTAVDIGNNGSDAFTLNTGAYAGNGSLVQDAAGIPRADVGTDSNDSAYDIGNNSAGIRFSGASAGYQGGISGNGDTAYDAGNNNGFSDGAKAGAGNNDYASDSGNNAGSSENAWAGLGNNNTAIDDSSATLTLKGVQAVGGNDNYASVYGPDNSVAIAFNGNSNVAYVDDPYGTAGAPDSAFAGGGYSNDLAEVLFTHGDAVANTDNFLYDIVSLFGNNAGSY